VTCQIILCNYLKEANKILIIVVFLSGIIRDIWTIDRCLTGLLGQLLVSCSGQLQARILLDSFGLIFVLICNPDSCLGQSIVTSI
jgi:hypothetical protein